MDYAQMTEQQAMEAIESNVNMTPQEKLFAKLFYHETMLVKDMEILQLRAHREELAQIAFEARARLSAVDAAEHEKKKGKKNGATGFERSLNADDTSTNAINTIKERQGRMSKSDRVRANMIDGYMKAGHSKGEAEELTEHLMRAGTLLVQTKKAVEDAKVLAASKETNPSEQNKPLFNPFDKKE